MTYNHLWGEARETVRGRKGTIFLCSRSGDGTEGRANREAKEEDPVRIAPSIFGKGMTLIPTRKRFRGSFIRGNALYRALGRSTWMKYDRYSPPPGYALSGSREREFIRANDIPRVATADPRGSVHAIRINIAR